MQVDPTTAAASATRDGVTYHFCSTACRDAFVADPHGAHASHHGSCH
ncbi:MAG: hypothetical protein C4344_05775 [Acidimicrobiia bacterium]